MLSYCPTFLKYQQIQKTMKSEKTELYRLTLQIFKYSLIALTWCSSPLKLVYDEFFTHTQLKWLTTATSKATDTIGTHHKFSFEV